MIPPRHDYYAFSFAYQSPSQKSDKDGGRSIASDPQAQVKLLYRDGKTSVSQSISGVDWDVVNSLWLKKLNSIKCQSSDFSVKHLFLAVATEAFSSNWRALKMELLSRLAAELSQTHFKKELNEYLIPLSLMQLLPNSRLITDLKTKDECDPYAKEVIDCINTLPSEADDNDGVAIAAELFKTCHTVYELFLKFEQQLEELRSNDDSSQSMSFFQGGVQEDQKPLSSPRLTSGKSLITYYDNIRPLLKSLVSKVKLSAKVEELFDMIDGKAMSDDQDVIIFRIQWTNVKNSYRDRSRQERPQSPSGPCQSPRGSPCQSPRAHQNNPPMLQASSQTSSQGREKSCMEGGFREGFREGSHASTISNCRF